MDERQQKQVNEAAEKFADALKESYQSIADRSVSAQELNAQVTQDFFNGVINNLRTQAENNRVLSEDLIEQQRKQQEASQALAQESLGLTWTSSTPCSPTTGATSTRRSGGPTSRVGAGWSGPCLYDVSCEQLETEGVAGELRQR
jgi:hypothetical protein